MYKTCHACNGLGYIVLKDAKGNEMAAKKCPVCYGSGKVDDTETNERYYVPWVPCPCPTLTHTHTTHIQVVLSLSG